MKTLTICKVIIQLKFKCVYTVLTVTTKGDFLSDKCFNQTLGGIWVFSQDLERFDVRLSHITTTETQTCKKAF